MRGLVRIQKKGVSRRLGTGRAKERLGEYCDRKEILPNVLSIRLKAQIALHFFPARK